MKTVLSLFVVRIVLLVIMPSISLHAEEAKGQVGSPSSITPPASTQPSQVVPAPVASAAASGEPTSPSAAQGPVEEGAKDPVASLLKEQKIDEITDQILPGEDPYKVATWSSLLYTMIRMKALTLQNEDSLVDEYALVTHCNDYKMNFRDDFKWNSLRAQYRQESEDKAKVAPLHYRYDRLLQLGRYNFKDQLYPLTEQTAIVGMNAFTFLVGQSEVCHNYGIRNLPMRYRAVISPAITLTSFPITQDKAELLLHYMDEHGNRDHAVYARFNLTIRYIMPWKKMSRYLGGNSYFFAQNPALKDELRMEARLESIQFYADKSQSLLMYNYIPD